MKKAYFTVLTIFFVGIFSVFTLPQSGGTFVIQKSVIGGGGELSSGGAFVVNGTTGQSVAGMTSTGGTFELGGGFWGGGTLSSAVTVSGRVMTPLGAGLRNAIVSITNTRTGERRTTNSGITGAYSFTNVLTNDLYSITVSSKRYRFDIQMQFISDNLAGLDFTGEE